MFVVQCVTTTGFVTFTSMPLLTELGSRKDAFCSTIDMALLTELSLVYSTENSEEPDFSCARKNMPGGGSFHSQSSILYPLWLRLCRAASWR